VKYLFAPAVYASLGFKSINHDTIRKRRNPRKTVYLGTVIKWFGSLRKTLTLEMLKRYNLGNYSKVLDLIYEIKPVKHFGSVQHSTMTCHTKIRIGLNSNTQILTLDDDWQTYASC